MQDMDPGVLAKDVRTMEADLAGFLGRRVGRVPLDGLELAVMHGDGNVIVVVDEQLSCLAPADVDGVLGRTVCESFTAVRVDGAAFLRPDGPAIRMTYFERDGTRSQMCGNALRCSTRYCRDRGYNGAEAVIRTDDGDKRVWAYDDTVRVALGPGREFRRVAAERYFVFSGLPHLVLLVDDGDDLDALDVVTDGAALRYDHGLCLRLGHPEGLHVDYMQRQPDGVRIRTYEVGVEDETLACGTGSAAAAFVAHQAWGTLFPVAVHCRGGVITVDASEGDLLISGTVGYLTGPSGRGLG
jgi:diaminopimelate epimerase